MSRPIVLDLSRLLLGAANRTPRGIERIEMGYARAIFAGDDAAEAILPSPVGARSFGAGRARAFIDAVGARWREAASVESDPVYARIKGWLTKGDGGAADGPAPARPSAVPLPFLYLDLASKLGLTGGAAARTRVPARAIYLVTGQTLLAFPYFFRWLESRPDVTAIFMIHDVIPITFPEYSPPSETRLARRQLQTTARYASALIAPSGAAARDISTELAKIDRKDMPIHVAPLPITEEFFEPLTEPPPAARQPYFVVVGVIDPRKNHLLLLQVWRELCRRFGDAAPLLVIIGSRGTTNPATLAMLERCPGIEYKVIEAAGLSSPALRHLIAGARALLMPSFMEGFGLPIIEAMTLRTPVIASDIPAHHDAGGSHATYLSPIDGEAWLEEIHARTVESDADLSARRGALEDYHPQTWQSYFAELKPFLDSFA